MKNMDKNTLALKLLATIFLLLSCHLRTAKPQWAAKPQITPRPLCATQFALVNSACSMLPFMQVPPPSPTTPPPPPPEGRRYRLRRSRSHRHHHSHHRQQHPPGATRLGAAPVEQTCCRWLKEIDSVCVCDLLVYLPSFLTRPVHNYTVAVEDLCSVNFQCGSRLVRKV